MPIISTLGRRSWSGRILTVTMYLVLSVLSVTMVTPFLITGASSICNDYDFERYLPLPRFLRSRPDRFVKGLVLYFNRYPKWYDQMGARFETMPAHWTSWRDIGRDLEGADALANNYLGVDGGRSLFRQRMTADYADFCTAYPMVDQLATVGDMDAAAFLADRYVAEWCAAHPDEAATLSRGAQRTAGLKLLSAMWGVPLPNFYLLGFEKSEMRDPYWQQSWFPKIEGAKYKDFLLVKRAAAYHVFTPGVEKKWRTWARTVAEGRPVPTLTELVASDDPWWQARWMEFKRRVAPATPVQPMALRVVWRQYLDTAEARRTMGLATDELFGVEVYNRLAGTDYTHINQTPFPVPVDAPDLLQTLWHEFVRTRYPVRLITIGNDPELTGMYHAFLRERFRTVEYANRMLGTAAATWEDFPLATETPIGTGGGELRSVWIDFVKSLPVEHRTLHSSEEAYQDLLRERYGSLEGVNAAYGTRWRRFEEAFPPFDEAYAATFDQNEWAFSLLPGAGNYRFILTFLFTQGRALFVTIVLVSLAILATLTINPMAAYALSRFNLRGKDKVILFLLATMAFPAMVSAIPAYLLMRDLGLLNTFFVLVLPSAANGMAIFILKGFFDSLPKELYEAATIDGAKEWQIFLVITMPMMKPILAINALNAFIMAYNGWQWALIICQDREMWTLAVWMYQANQWWSITTPWVVMAGFVVVSIPTLLVFTFCQKIIMRGIILPQMK